MRWQYHKWLRDELKLIHHVSETETLANSITDTGGVYLVPAFVGLGAPYWNSTARGALLGLTYNSGPAQIIRAALESVAYQTKDLLEAVNQDFNAPIDILRVDGGMSVNNWLLQYLADILNITIERPLSIETTALGAAYLAGLQIGLYQSLEDIALNWTKTNTYIPKMSDKHAELLYLGWQAMVKRVL